MLSVVLKEFKGFFGSLIGYLVVMVYLTTNGVLLWIFPGSFNIPLSGYATLDSLFVLSPWMFMFLIPAISMRMIAEERKTGTIDLLLTRPISELELVFAKYISAMALVIISILPTLIYFFTVWYLGSPRGVMDTGGTIGSFLGLVLLASVYVSIGIFSSSLTDNQIVAFLISIIIIFILYTGLYELGNLSDIRPFGTYISALSIQAHYISISRGVIDSRDLLYFLSATFVFIYFTSIKFQSRKW